MQLYNIDRFDLDCTYSTGNFWKDLPKLRHKSDLNPKSDDVIKAYSIQLPFEYKSMFSIMFDPPFVISGENYKKYGESSIISNRFEAYRDFEELKKHYFLTLKETCRLLKNDGILVLKCQDTVSGSKNHFTHFMVMNMALKVGYYLRDLFILIAKNRINSFGEKWKKQHHARKYHCYFWIFQKKKCNINYEF